ncbi:MAG: protein-glutamate O-methyltransferase [Pseudomonadota bacterium]
MRHPPSQPTLDDRAFDAIAALAYRESGIQLLREKKLMVQSRLRHRLRALKLDAFSAYTEHVLSEQGTNERRFMISALTTNVSHFFREAQHFDVLTTCLLPVFRDRVDQGKRIRIWSAGCSNGQEPYSIAMHLLACEPALEHADFRILGTDIDPHVITHARAGIYSGAQIAGIPPRHRAHFLAAMNDSDDAYAVSASVKRVVSFQELNLFSQWPMRFPFDAIFCRNVVIYFDQQTQERLWPRFGDALAPGGLFFLGHSERVANPARYGFRSAGPTAYHRSGDPLHAAVQ